MSRTDPHLCTTVPQPAHRQYPYLNVLDGHVTKSDAKVFVEIRILSLHEHEGVACIKGTVEADNAQKAEIWLEELLKRAYSTCAPSAAYTCLHQKKKS